MRSTWRRNSAAPSLPPFLRAAVRHALMLALRELRTAYEAGTDHSYTATERAWKLFLLAPRMLLVRPAHRQGPRGREELLARAATFEQGEWTSLIENARQLPVPTESPSKSDEVLAAERRERACAKVRIGEVSRARQILTAAEFAPGTEDTFHALTGPERRPPAARTPIPPKVLARIQCSYLHGPSQRHCGKHAEAVRPGFPACALNI